MRILLVALLLAGCAHDPTDDPDDGPPELVGDPNFALYVSNQSFDIDPVDIRFSVDGRLLAEGEFLVEGQHSWHRFDLHVDPGLHVFHAESDAGGVALTETLKMRPYGILDFWYYPAGETYPEPTPAQFTLQLQDSAPQFQ